jgi:hypothetical protein
MSTSACGAGDGLRARLPIAPLLPLKNPGPRTLQSLALIAEVVHGAPSRFSIRPASPSPTEALGFHPFRCWLKTYDESIDVCAAAPDGPKIGDQDKLEGFATGPFRPRGRKAIGRKRISRCHRARQDFTGIEWPDGVRQAPTSPSLFD